jgi:hypothetical protein
MKEKLEKDRQEIFKEGLSYAAELAYFIGVLISLALCSGMFIENPVQERLKKMRYYLHVLGLNGYIYWLGNLIFDFGIFLIQAFLLIVLVFPLRLEAYSYYFTLYTLLILSFGLSHVTFSYLLSFFFASPDSAIKAFSLLYLLGGLFVPLLLKTLLFASGGCPAYHLGDTLAQLIPLTPLCSGFLSLISRKHDKFFQFQKRREQEDAELMAELADDSGFHRARNEYWECKSWYAEVESSIVVMVASAVLYAGCVIGIEWYRERKVRRAEQERYNINDTKECVR